VGTRTVRTSAFYVGESDVGVASPIGETRIRKIQLVFRLDRTTQTATLQNLAVMFGMFLGAGDD
jgi:hypothetical protein